ncbi:hypothetical protein H1R20_g8495, partial [Candolleomyces eurysporus]
MASFVVKKLFERHLEGYAPADPLYELYTDEQGKQQRRKRELPPGLSERDAKILRSVKRRAHRLDRGFSLCGMHFGWTFFISLVPVIGDVVNASLNYFLVRRARGADLPPMACGTNDVEQRYQLWANSRNAVLLEEFLRLRGEEYLRLHPESEVEAEPGNQSGSRVKSKNGGGLTEKDVEQVKPGSGLEPGETIELVEIAPAPVTAQEIPTLPQPVTTSSGQSFVPA